VKESEVFLSERSAGAGRVSVRSLSTPKKERKEVRFDKGKRADLREN